MLTVEIRTGTIVGASGLDAVVNPTDTDLLMSGRTASLVMVHGGEAVTKEAAAQAPLRIGTAVATRAGALENKQIFHAAVMGYRIEDLTVPLRPGSLSSDDILREAFTHALTLADASGCTSIGAPLLSSGIAGFPDEAGAQAMLQALFDFVIAHPSTAIERVVVLCYDEDERASCASARTSLVTLEERARAAQEQDTAAKRAREEGVRVERERAERERRERAEQERNEREQRERREAEQRERERIERERVERERAERARLEAEEEDRRRRERMFSPTQVRKLTDEERAVVAGKPPTSSAKPAPKNSASVTSPPQPAARPATELPSNDLEELSDAEVDAVFGETPTQVSDEPSADDVFDAEPTRVKSKP